MTHSNDTVYSPERQCKGKKGYGSKAIAKRHARRARLRKVFAYRCPHCGSFHLGHRA